MRRAKYLGNDEGRRDPVEVTELLGPFLESIGTGARMDSAQLFGESPSRVVACVHPELLQPVVEVCEQADVPVTRLGLAGGDRCSVKGLFDIALDDATAAWRGRLPEALGAGTAQS